MLVELPLKEHGTGLVVPDTAVLYDIHGATWVYEDLGGNAYARRRVEIARHAGDRAVVARGLAEGDKVVTAGAAELFGTEFGAGTDMRWLVALSLRNRIVVVALGVLLVVGAVHERCAPRRSTCSRSSRRRWSRCRPRRRASPPTTSSRWSPCRSKRR